MNYIGRWLYYAGWRQWHKKLLSAGFQGDFKKIRKEIEDDLHRPIEQGRRSLFTTYLYELVRKHRPIIVLELGVQRGCSTFAILKGLADNGEGELHSIDMVPDVFFQKLVAPVVPGELKARWHYHEGDSTMVLQKVLREVDHVDMAFHDAIHESDIQFKELQAIWDKGAKIVAVDYADNNLAEYSSKIIPKPSMTTYDYEHDGIYPIGVMFR